MLPSNNLTNTPHTYYKMLNFLFESKDINDFLKICNEIYTKAAVESLAEFFAGSTPSLREVSNAAIEYCNADKSPFDDNVYLFTSPNGKQYTGQTIHLNTRINSYKNGDGSNKHWSSSLKKYGFDNFIFEHYAIPTACADIIEKFMILWYDLMNRNKGYNKQSGGKNGWMMSDDTRSKISAAHLGKKKSDEHKAALSASWSHKRKQAFSDSQLGIKNHNFNKKLPHVSESNRIRIVPTRSKASRAKSRAAMLGKKLTQNHKAALSESWTQERKQAYSESQSSINSHRAQPVVVEGILYPTAKEASKEKYGNNFYVKTFISRHKNSTEIFKVSKEFYKYCIDNKIDYIEYEMVKKFEQYIMPS